MHAKECWLEFVKLVFDMSYNDGIADLITRIRNGYMAGLDSVQVLSSRMNISILSLLQEGGYIKSFNIVEGTFYYKVNLRYVNNRPAVNSLVRISKSGSRVYSSCKNIGFYYNGFSTVILSTSKGVITDKLARKYKVGGEVLFYVF